MCPSQAQFADGNHNLSAVEVARCSACRLTASKAGLSRGGTSRRCQTDNVSLNAFGQILRQFADEILGEPQLPQSVQGESACSTLPLQECEEPQFKPCTSPGETQRSLFCCSIHLSRESVPCFAVGCASDRDAGPWNLPGLPCSWGLCDIRVAGLGIRGFSSTDGRTHQGRAPPGESTPLSH